MLQGKGAWLSRSSQQEASWEWCSMQSSATVELTMDIWRRTWLPYHRFPYLRCQLSHRILHRDSECNSGRCTHPGIQLALYQTRN